MRKALLAAILALSAITQAHATIYWFGTNDKTHTMSPCSADNRFQTINGMITFLNSAGRPISWEQDGPWGASGLYEDGSSSVVYITTNPFACRNTTAALENKGYLVQDNWGP